MATKNNTLCNVSVEAVVKSVFDALFGQNGAFNEVDAEDLDNTRLVVTKAVTKLASKSTVTTRAQTTDPLKAPTTSASGNRGLAAHTQLSSFLKKDSFTDDKKALVVSFVGPLPTATVATKENWAKIASCTNNPVAVQMIAGEKVTLGMVFPMLVKQLSHLPSCALMAATLSQESKELLGLSAPKKSASPTSPTAEKAMNHTNYLWVVSELVHQRWSTWGPLPQEFMIELSSDTKASVVEARTNLVNSGLEGEVNVQEAFNELLASLGDERPAKENQKLAASALWHNGLSKALKKVKVE